ncbi:hypothetical protein MB901379_02822 [Mycobacterium basiliense]|uniref:Uncharacterized protein n=1 Tax=Mycobacterium basiliense TaxID=2094119 RepID=A0A447GFJ7_9MYCO|nr:hypothetical protein MB901379_02822 [Mycobacterium basiliense]
MTVMLMKCATTTRSVSAAIITRPNHALLIFFHIGRGPGTSGRVKSDPAAVCQATRIVLALARKKRRGTSFVHHAPLTSETWSARSVRRCTGGHLE